MKIDREEARRIAALAHLEFDEESLGRIAAEMTGILDYIEMLRDAKTGDQVPAADPAPMRDDEARPSISRDSVAANAPSFENGFFVVPKVIE